MTDGECNCRALYTAAFPEYGKAFVNLLFAGHFPDDARVIWQGQTPLSMLFSIPYPLLTAQGEVPAHYLYGLVTDPRYRGLGYARTLLQAEAKKGPVFLRPMHPDLFDFYEKIGFAPLSPVQTIQGQAISADTRARHLTAAEYLCLRETYAPLPNCRPTTDFLSLYEVDGGGCATYDDRAVALYEVRGETVFFKEYWGDIYGAPRLAAFLGGKQFSLRRPAAKGAFFGMGAGLPRDAAFLAALD